MSKCEFCGENINWCSCPEDCANGYHIWNEDKMACRGCGIRLEIFYKQKQIIPDTKKDDNKDAQSQK